VKVVRCIGACAAAGLALVGAALGVTEEVSGRLLFATAGDGVTGRLEIASVNPDGRGFSRITRHDPSGYSPRWTRDGRAIVFTTYDQVTDTGAHWRMRPDGSGFKRLSADEYSAASPTGRLVAEFGRRGIKILKAGGRTVRTLRLRLGEGDLYDGQIVWSQDERLIAVSVATEADDGEYVRTFVLRVDGRAAARAISPKIHGRFEYALSWSPRRHWLATDVSSSADYTTIALVRSDGRGRRVLVADAAASGVHAWSPDGTRLAYVGRKGDIFVVEARTRRVRRLARTRSLGQEVNAIDVRWSPGGRDVAFSDVGGIYRLRAKGSKPRRVTAHGRWSDLDWSPDGRQLVFSESYDIYVVRADGTGLRRITQALQDDAPVASPDGRRIAFIRGTRELRDLEDTNPIAIFIVGSDGEGLRRIGRGYDPQWASDSRRLAFVDVLPDDPPQLRALRTGRIMVADVEDNTVRQVALGTAPAWSPDGAQLAFMRYAFDVRDTWRGISARTTKAELWIVRLDGSEPRKALESGPSGDEEGGEELLYRPSWSPDGRWIALVGSSSTKLFDPTTGTVRRLDDSTADIAWSPDSTRLLETPSYPDELRIVDVATGTVRVVVADREDFRLFFPVWSPDGASVGFVGCDTRNDSPSCDVYVVNSDGTGRRRVTHTPGIEEALTWAR
jgi:Tol biopolymer transport system component